MSPAEVRALEAMRDGRATEYHRRIVRRALDRVQRTRVTLPTGRPQPTNGTGVHSVSCAQMSDVLSSDSSAVRTRHKEAPVTTLEERVRSKLAQEIEATEASLADTDRMLVDADEAYTAAQAAEEAAWGDVDPEGDGTQPPHAAWVAASDMVGKVGARYRQLYARRAALVEQLAKLRGSGETEARLQAAQANEAKFAELRERQPKREPSPRAEARKAASANDDPALVAEMEGHKPGYEAYVAARKAGDEQAKAANADAYRGYKRAYSALLKARKAGQ